MFSFKNRINEGIIRMIGRRIHGVAYFFVQYQNGETRRYTFF